LKFLIFDKRFDFFKNDLFDPHHAEGLVNPKVSAKILVTVFACKFRKHQILNRSPPNATLRRAPRFHGKKSKNQKQFVPKLFKKYNQHKLVILHALGYPKTVTKIFALTFGLTSPSA
jgi:hypothetical protein